MADKILFIVLILNATCRGILEAMACGKPVVILGENNEAEVVGPENVEDVAYYNFSGRHFRQRKKGPEQNDTLCTHVQVTLVFGSGRATDIDVINPDHYADNAWLFSYI